MLPTFSLLTELAGDPIQLELFGPDGCLQSWLAAERALALAQSELGIIDPADATAISAAASLDNIDRDELWASAKHAGYPILGLVRQISRLLPAGPNGRVHFGATTQDIMDTGLALQLQRSLYELDSRVAQLGQALARQCEAHAHTVMPARTHAQQAVPTTLGATLASLLAQLARHRERMTQALPRVASISMFGAGGTSAAYGARSIQLREGMARWLGLRSTNVPWHVARDGLAEYGWLCVVITATCARFARNVVDLSRTEIGEVSEPFVSHRGASSTMPQKVNPISSEAIIGLSATAGALASSLARMQEAGHERAAGEWQIEWQVIPQLGVLAGSALAEAQVIIDGLQVDADRMGRNLDLDGGLIMAEAHMIHLAQKLGREVAHDLVYEAAQRARSEHRVLRDTLPEVLAEHGLADELPAPIRVADYVGEAQQIVAEAVRLWGAAPAVPAVPAMSELAGAGPARGIPRDV
ncbi:3-carboxy-cis,cis-muconate cycloisomerase [Mycobacterium basiliense]|uniref:3-carboxy-cis,cis-muconate cycloisomerase n=1 Tax=Mycobacterium basiliense TaxID=2094119 RepID=A0A3S4FSW8_9MYCO|nr:lyase family protein [Mycobacterium basiliense]VDM90004.1 3-carboxy-cis,cis-muconate cycloisomerase [Mycobacterium basiliense]